MEVGEACLPTFGGAPRGFRVSRSPGFPGWPAALPGFVGPAFPGLARVRSWVRLLRFRGSCLTRAKGAVGRGRAHLGAVPGAGWAHGGLFKQYFFMSR